MTNPASAPGVIQHEAIVHKANIPLAKDESVYDFTNALGEAVRAYVLQSKRMDPKSDYCYVVEVYTASVIVSYSIYGDKSAGTLTKPSYGYVAVQYVRDADTKVFTFSDMTEVERVTTYRAKTLLKTVKSATAAPECEVFEAGDGAHGWIPQSKARKALWAGVV